MVEEVCVGKKPSIQNTSRCQGPARTKKVRSPYKHIQTNKRRNTEDTCPSTGANLQKGLVTGLDWLTESVGSATNQRYLQKLSQVELWLLCQRGVYLVDLTAPSDSP